MQMVECLVPKDKGSIRKKFGSRGRYVEQGES